MIQGQFRPVSATGQYDPIGLIRPDSNRIYSIWHESEPSWRESKRKKKKLKRDTNVWAIASVAAPHVWPHRTLVRHPPSYIGVS